MGGYSLNIGDAIPLADVKEKIGKQISDLEWKEKFLILYFYPKDDTPGCTQEACSFRDNLAQLIQQGALVVGVSPDAREKHEKFMTKYNLNFNLIADEKRELCSLLGIKKGLFGIERTTFLINPQGQICWLERPVKVAGHVERVLRALQATRPRR